MSIVWLVSALTLMGVVCRTEQNNCSNHALLSHLNLEKRSAALAELRPVKNFTQKSSVMVDMLLNSVLEMNEKTQTFSCFVTVAISWYNDFLQWEPKDFCGNSRIYIQREKLWLPDIIVLQDISNSGPSRYNQYALLLSFGLVQVVDRYQLTTTCKMDLYKFPFDTQICYITFQSVLNNEDEVELWTYFDYGEMNDYTRDAFTSLGEWDFLGLNKTVEKYSIDTLVWDQLKYMITLERKPLLYLINLVIPITFLVILDLASFFISEARGEKLGFKVTILLAISVLLLILQDILPSTAKTLPLIALLCIVIFTLTGLSLLETMAVSFLVDLEDWFEKDGQKAVCVETPKVAEECQVPGCQKELVTDAGFGSEKMENQPKNSDADEVKSLSDHLKPSKKKPGYYAKVAKTIDIIYFWLYFITCIGFMVYMCHEWFY
ncbi:5-hydroxytryptamine receptor 3A-like [Centroberyx affinis]|uniref:5-hydroxytryptamine receptor 3A-like n=1 Tax=Centroberyx affinis TaxID=166261 RepID=UPI003A5BE3D1